MMAKKRICMVIAVGAAALLAQGLAEAKGGKSGGGRTGASRSGGWHSGGHVRGKGAPHFRSRGAAHFARHGRVWSGGFLVGAPVLGAGYALYPHYSSYPPPAASQIYYIEKTDGYWYYCTEAGRYYPDVEQCESPWVRVQAWKETPAG